MELCLRYIFSLNGGKRSDFYLKFSIGIFWVSNRKNKKPRIYFNFGNDRFMSCCCRLRQEQWVLWARYVSLYRRKLSKEVRLTYDKHSLT